MLILFFKSFSHTTPLWTQLQDKRTTWFLWGFFQWRKQCTHFLPILQGEFWGQNFLARPWSCLICYDIFHIPVCVLFSISWGFFTRTQIFFGYLACFFLLGLPFSLNSTCFWFFSHCLQFCYQHKNWFFPLFIFEQRKKLKQNKLTETEKKTSCC